MKESFEVDHLALQSRFKAMQREWHPDKFGNRSSEDQATAANMSARLNEAYYVLRAPYRRAEHLLQIRAETNSDQRFSTLENTPLDPSFLIWVMETREAISKAVGNQQELNSLRNNLDETLHACLSRLADAFSSNKLTVAAEETAKLQYLRRMEQAFEDFSQ